MRATQHTTDSLGQANTFELATAPMMDWSDRHCRYFWRLIAPSAVLYSEMVTTGALIHGDQQWHLQYHPSEHPIVLQLGGNDPKDLAYCAELAQRYGYDEVNLNCGCPSDRVQAGGFGAYLMGEPETVRDCVAAMIATTDCPITVKHRLGIDHQDTYEELKRFIEIVAQSGCTKFIVHARKAWLDGLSPKQNRDIPPLNYAWVYRLKEDFPELSLIINGGITSPSECIEHAQYLDGVMIGREAYHNPWQLRAISDALYGTRAEHLNQADIMQAMIEYSEEQLRGGVKLNHITRHLLHFYQGCSGAKRFRRHLSEHAHKQGATAQVLQDALALINPERLRA